MNFTCSLEKRHSEKSGNDYMVLVIRLTDTYEKVVFLDNSELEILRLMKDKNSSK